MVKHDQSPTPHQQSRKFRVKPLKGASVEVTGFGDGCNVQISCADSKCLSKKPNVESPELLTTGELISAVGRIWDSTSRTLARLQARTGPNCSDTVGQKGSKIRYLVEDDDVIALDVIDRECLQVRLNSRSYFPNIVQRSLEWTRMMQNICYRPCEDQYIQSFLPGNCNDSSAKETITKEKSRANVGLSCGLMNKNRWMGQTNPRRWYPEFTFREIPKDQFSSSRCTDIENRKASTPSVYSDYFLQAVQNRHHTAIMSTALNLAIKPYSSISEEGCSHDAIMSTALNLAMKPYTSISETGCSHEANHLQSEADDILEDGLVQFEESNIESSPVMNKPQPLLAKQEHAISGALSGVVVSLCLHPVDTVKTVLQSCQVGQKSLCYIGQSIIAERGLSGLYRGISSNITTSAPISALYTFTYESVKGFLLPSLAKEYHSVAHCSAGGCASIATSFIFTPSDHIKQQMQVNSKYQNCWTAALRVIEKGGLLSLYAGWGAVLCRNIPHSIIKFYTYESLKQMFISSELPNSQLKTPQTLLCGGLAGSAAALFSTPFDVVKTRLQTQMPGSARKYQNILNALRLIRQQEGVKGLYRGLIPRLIMYMSQGALFFASYEFFQGLLSLDRCRDSSDTLQYKQDTDDDETLLPV